MPLVIMPNLAEKDFASEIRIRRCIVDVGRHREKSETKTKLGGLFRLDNSKKRSFDSLTQCGVSIK